MGTSRQSAWSFKRDHFERILRVSLRETQCLMSPLSLPAYQKDVQHSAFRRASGGAVAAYGQCCQCDQPAYPTDGH